MNFKKLLSLGLAFVLSLSFVFFLPLDSVSALSISRRYDFNISKSDSKLWVDAIYDNSYLPSWLDREHCYFNLTFDNSGSSPVLKRLVLFNISESRSGSNSSFSFLAPTSHYIQWGSFNFTSPSQLASVNLNNYTQSGPGSTVACIAFIDNYFMTYIDRSSNPVGDLVFSDFASISGNTLLSSFEPDPYSYQLTGFIVGSDTSMEAFYQWIIDNNKLSELPSYIVSSKLKSLIDFYHSYGGSLTGFIHYLPQWLSYVSLPSQTQENSNILKNKLDSLYSEFLNQYKVTIERGNSANQAHHRNNIDTKTDDSNLSLVTDSPSDDIVTSILRDILRGVIAIPVSIYNNTNALLEKLDGLNFTTTVVNNGGVPSGTDINPLLQKMDDIIEALQADTVSVEIDQTTQDDTDQFLSDWADDFSVELDSKFPVINQLGSLFSDDFFEKCGIDTDGDGEVFEYYNPEVALSRSAPASSESDIVFDFLNQFDDSDPAFLDNVSFSESVPDWSVSIAGTKVSVFSFKLYAKYRTWIHTIISFIIWTCFLLGLYKSLPGLIGNVANTFDVSHDIFDDKTTSK